jgi:hypothetical protein
MTNRQRVTQRQRQSRPQETRRSPWSPPFQRLLRNPNQAETPPVSSSSGTGPTCGGLICNSFQAFLVQAPPDGAIIGGKVFRFTVKGFTLANVELLPDTGFEPKYMSNLDFTTFSQTDSDFPGTLVPVRSGTWDTTKLPNGVYRVRMSVFDKPAGDPTANEMVVFTRTYTIANIDCSHPNSSLGQNAACSNLDAYWNLVQNEDIRLHGATGSN